jgi:hypothetical protein
MFPINRHFDILDKKWKLTIKQPEPQKNTQKTADESRSIWVRPPPLPGVSCGSCNSIFSFMCMLCRSLFVPFLTIVLSVLLRYTYYDYFFGIFKLFCLFLYAVILCTIMLQKYNIILTDVCLEYYNWIKTRVSCKPGNCIGVKTYFWHNNKNTIIEEFKFHS